MLNVRDFGAKGDGVSDDTAAIQSAINAAGISKSEVHIPRGTYLHTGLTIEAHGVHLVGEGKSVSMLKYTPTEGNAITVGISGTKYGHIGIRNVGVCGTGTQTSGALIQVIDVTCIELDGIYVGMGHNGVVINSTGLQYNAHITNFEINNLANGIILGNSFTVCEVFISNGSLGGCSVNGVACLNTSGTYVSDVSIIKCEGAGISISPITGRKSEAAHFTNVLTDTCGIGILIMGAGKVADATFMNCWSCTNTQYGFYLIGDDQDDVRIEGCTILNNKSFGILLYKGNNTIISGNGIYQNSTSFINGASGIQVMAGVSGFIITNNIIGLGGTLKSAGNNQSYGVIIQTGNSNHYIISNNRCPGNNLGTISDGGLGPDKQIVSNLSG